MIALVTRFLRRVSASLRFRLRAAWRGFHATPSQTFAGAATATAQVLLQFEYRRLVREKAPLPAFQDVGFKVWSQTDEDGILLYLFSIIGCESKRCVEICAGDGLECNTANLTLNHGWGDS